MDGLRSLDEQTDGFIPGQTFGRYVAGYYGKVQGWDQKLAFAMQVERDPAGRQDFQSRRGGEQISRDGRCRGQLFKVVQHEQQVLVAKIVFDVLQQRPAAPVANLELLSNARDKVTGV